MLARCTEPLVEQAIDMRGSWKVVESTANGQPSDRLVGAIQRIQQCGNRVVITRPIEPISLAAHTWASGE